MKRGNETNGMLWQYINNCVNVKINDLELPIKSKRLADWCKRITTLTSKIMATGLLKMKKNAKRLNQKNAGVAALKSDV